MQQFRSVDDVLDFAIGEEEAAQTFYMDMAGKAALPGMKELFEGFAQEELGHKEKLLRVKEGKLLIKSERKVLDLKIGDYLVEITPYAEMDLQQALMLAMQKEKAAFKLYSDLAAGVDDENLRNTFTTLAQEEARHKLRFEIMYDDQILTEN